MKNCLVVLGVALGIGVSVALLNLTLSGDRVAASTSQDAKGPIYAQLSSAVTQVAKAGTPQLIAMETNDSISGIDHNIKDKPENVVVKTAGVYIVIAAVQVGKDKGDTAEFLDIWIKQNGADVANSNCRQTVKDAAFTTVLVCQGIMECKAGDVVNVAMSASGAGLGAYAFKPNGEPVVPSIIFSMYKIN